MKWTRKKPDTASYYWYKEEDCDWETVEVRLDYGYLRIWHIGDERESKMKDQNGWWSDSAIKKPKET